MANETQKTKPAPPTLEQYREARERILLDFCPSIYSCQKCGWPVVDGYCCGKCGDSEPYEK